MSKYYYKKHDKKNVRAIMRVMSFVLFAAGVLVLVYIFFPLISWRVFFAPAFASQNIAIPIPKTTVVNSSTIQSLLTTSYNALSGVDYTNAQNWFPNLKTDKGTTPEISSYYLSIPILHVNKANVSTMDTDLDSHLVNYPGTAIPPNKGNAVIFGHSTLPQWFDPTNYKAIFATAYRLNIGDEIVISLSNISYTYKIFSITVVDPSDTSVFAQSYDDSYLTLITCTPPGTTWKRLIIKARLQKI